MLIYTEGKAGVRVAYTEEQAKLFESQGDTRIDYDKRWGAAARRVQGIDDIPKTTKQLKKWLDDNSVPYPDDIKKPELVNLYDLAHD